MTAMDSKCMNASHVVVVGGGVGGLSAAVMARAEGVAVTLVERAATPGGKMRRVPSAAGGVDAGPTVLTLREVFDEIFTASGARIENYVTLHREPCLARHFWPDGSQLDLWDDPEQNARAIEAFAGPGARRDFEAHAREAAALFDLYDAPMMRAAEPSVATLARRTAGAPGLVTALLPGLSLAAALARRFRDPRLRQLFARYATYVGGMPRHVPALLQLVSQAEARGVWRVEGGMAELAQAMARRLADMGGRIMTGCDVARIEAPDGVARAVALGDGRRIAADAVIFAGDACALGLGLFGPQVAIAGAASATRPRSLSARVWSFAATVADAPDLAHHNVFFADDPDEEFRAIAEGRVPRDPSLYVCAQDRGHGRPIPTGPERFEIIINAAPLTIAPAPPDEVETCRRTTFPRLQRFGLRLTEPPPDEALTTPTDFAAMYPGSAGAIYGESPAGMMSALRRPRARTAIRGLYLAGGTVHPGPGVPMAARSGVFAARAMAEDLVST